VRECPAIAGFFIPEKIHKNTVGKEDINKELKLWHIAILIAGIIIFGLILYLSTVSSYVDFRDSGESVACAVITGVAHPPGYPLYTLVSKLFTYIPVDTVVFRVNLVSIISAILALVFLALSALRIIPSIYGTALAILILAVSPTFWDYAIFAKCYALGLCIISLMIFISLGYRYDHKPVRICIVALLLGLGISNHYQTVLLFFPAILFFLAGPILKNDKKLFYMFLLSFLLFVIFTISHGIKPLKILFAALLAGFYLYYLYRSLAKTPVKYIPFHFLFFIAGLLPYLYIPWAAGRDPLINWDQADTLKGFWELISIADYRTSFEPSIISAISQLKLYFSLLYKQFGALGISLAGIGCAWLYKRKRFILEFLGLFWLFQVGGFALHLKTPMDELTPYVMEGFYLPSHLAIILTIATGGGVLYELLKKTGKTGISKIVIYALPFILFIVPVYRAVHDYKIHDRSEFYFADDYAHNVFLSLPESAILITQADDGTFPLWFKQAVEKVRPEIIIIFSDLLPRPWYRAQLEKKYNIKNPKPGEFVANTTGLMKELFKSNPGKLFYIDYFTRTSYGKNIPVLQEGIIFKVVNVNEQPGINIERTCELLAGYKLRGVFDPDIYRDFFVENMLFAYTKAYNDLGKALAEKGEISSAIDYMEKAMKINPENQVIRHNLKVLKRGKFKPSSEAEKIYKKGMESLRSGDFNSAISLTLLYSQQIHPV